MIFSLANRLISATIFFTLVSSCTPRSSSDSSGSNGTNPRDRLGQNTGNDEAPNDNKVCSAARVLKVLDNGRNVISRMAFDRSKIINWNVNDGKVISSLNFPVNLYQVSSDGKYILRRVNYKKFQLIKFGDKSKVNKVITLNAAYNPMPKLEFSPDGNYLIMDYVPLGQGYNHKIDIYDLEKEVFTSSMMANNVLFAKVTRDSKFYLVGYKTRYKTILKKIHTETAQVEYEIELNRFERFDKLYIGEDAFVVAGNEKHYGYDLLTGEKLYEKKVLSFIDVGSEGRYALVSEAWNEIKIVDLKNFDVIYQDKAPTGLVLSSCQLVDSPLKLICQDSIKQGSVSIWNIEQSQSKTSCF